MNGIIGNGQLQRLALAALAVALALAAAGCGGGGGRIVFKSKSEIYAINADGSGLTRLADFYGGSPTWSLDGQRVAFTSHREDVGFGIYAMNVDGSGLTRLADARDRENHISWSPDGQRIAFVPSRNISIAATREGGGAPLPVGIYVANVDGSGLTRVTDLSFEESAPSWSPDGQRIAFDDNDYRRNLRQIYVINVDGSGLTRLTDKGGQYPEWSPDGKRIAFVVNEYGDAEIHVINADGSDVAQLANRPEQTVTRLAWSPDGQRIAFSSFFPLAGATNQISVMNADGSGVAQLTDDFAGSHSPVWSPDGRRIAFLSGMNGSWGVYAMNADGSDVKRLINDPGAHWRPAWTR